MPYQDASNIKRWAAAGDGRRCRGNTWFIPYETIQSRDRDRPHPASFPPKVPEQCLRLHGLERAGMVLDPFLGLGSTAIAAARLGLDFVGIEMDEHYLKEAVKRVKEAGGTQASCTKPEWRRTAPLRASESCTRTSGRCGSVAPWSIVASSPSDHLDLDVRGPSSDRDSSRCTR